MGLSDESLLAGLVSGDPEASAAFVRRFQGRVYGLAVAILGERDAAEEVAQEAFVRAWRHGATHDPRRGEVSTWLLTITRNLSVDLLRMRRPVPVDPGVFLASALPGSEAGPEERGMAAAQLRSLRGAVTELPDEQRRALVLAAVFGRTAREISEIEGIPLGTAKTRIRTALLKLRSLLGVRGVSDE